MASSPPSPLKKRSEGDRLRARLRRARLELRLRLRDARPFVRRTIDVLAAGFGLLFLAPFLALVAIAIKLSSPGPVLFRQERIGRHGRRFGMLKLRTMIVGADAKKAVLATATAQGVRFKMKHDPRIFPLGRYLRKFSIDELPQLWNVLIGEMTLVGPRPPLRSEVERYNPYELRRLEMTQGLTCFWQVGGRSDIPFTEQVKLDIEYIDRSTPMDDFRLLTRTIPAVITGRGAY